MLQKLNRILGNFRDSEQKLAWMRDRLKWRYFAYTHRKHTRLNIEFDRAHRVDTATELQLAAAGVAPSEVARGNVVYRPLTKSLFRAAMASINIDPTQFTFVDIGSGKGKVLFMASDFPFKRIVGIEYASGLHEVALRNLTTYRSQQQRCADIEPVHADALTYTWPAGPLLLFIFNALAPEFMRTLLEKLDSNAASEGDRPVLLIYTNLRSVGEVGNVFDGLRNLRAARRANKFIVIANEAAGVVPKSAS